MIFLQRNPKAIATTIYNIEIDAAAALGCNFDPSTAEKPLNVPATISAKAAITNNVNNQQNKKNNFLPVFPIYSSIIPPIDFPLDLTDAYNAPKS